MYAVANVPVNQNRTRRKVQHIPSQRVQVSGVGLGEVDGLDIGKMFNNMFTIRKSSFTFKNVMGAIGSGVTNFMTLGLASALAPRTFSAHSQDMQRVGMGISAAMVAGGAVVGGMALTGAFSGAAGGGAGAGVATTTGEVGTAYIAPQAGAGVLLPSATQGTLATTLQASIMSGGSQIAPLTAAAVVDTGGTALSAFGSVFSTIGSGVLNIGKTVLGVLPTASQLLGGGGGGQAPQQQVDPSGSVVVINNNPIQPVPYYPVQDYGNFGMGPMVGSPAYMPNGFGNPGIPVGPMDGTAGWVQEEDGTIKPSTMIPGWSDEAVLGVGVVAVLGVGAWYFFM